MNEDTNHMLRHMLGLPAKVWADEKRPVPHRNYAAIGHDDPLMLERAAQGLVERYRRCENYDWWRCTESGIAEAHASVVVQKRSRSAARYDRWLSLDGCTGHRGFGEFLKDKDRRIVQYREHGEVDE